MSGPQPSGAGDPALYVGDATSTPLMFFSLNMATTPGRSESTYPAQLTKAIAYWTAVQATPSKNPTFGAYAGTALGWLQAELARVQNPPGDALANLPGV